MKSIAASIVVCAGVYLIAQSRESAPQLIGIVLYLYGALLLGATAFSKD
jgi:hypothetical protein